MPRFSDLEVVALSMTAEHLSIDSENLLFDRLNEYKSEFTNLISRRQYNDRKKLTRIIGKISAFTLLQYINCINQRPIGRVKYAIS